MYACMHVCMQAVTSGHCVWAEQTPCCPGDSKYDIVGITTGNLVGTGEEACVYWDQKDLEEEMKGWVAYVLHEIE